MKAICFGRYLYEPLLYLDQKIVEPSPVEGGSHAANESLSFLLPTEQRNGIPIVSLALGLQVMPAAPSDITDTSRKHESVQA
jgi:hypothetical protein